MPSEGKLSLRASETAVAGLISVAGIAFVSMIAFLYSQVQSLQREATENTSEIKRVDQRAAEEHAETQAQIDRRFGQDHDALHSIEVRQTAFQDAVNARASTLAELHAEQVAQDKLAASQDERITDILTHQIEVRTELATLKAQTTELQKIVDVLRGGMHSRKRSELPGLAEP
jgi:hypothetical protein